MFHLKLVRRPGKRNFGTLVVDKLFTCDTLEDEDRKLEAGGIKVKGQTAIPRGVYKVKIAYSPRFGKPLPLVVDVPQFEGIRIHGGVDEEDTEGCILVGVRTGDKLSRGLAISAQITAILSAAQARGEDIQLEVI